MCERTCLARSEAPGPQLTINWAHSETNLPAFLVFHYDALPEPEPEHKHKHHSASFTLDTPHHHRHFEASIERDSDRHHRHFEASIEKESDHHHHHEHEHKHKHTELSIELPHHHHEHEHEHEHKHKHTELSIELPHRHNHHDHPRRHSQSEYSQSEHSLSEVDFELERARQPRRYQRTEVDLEVTRPIKSANESEIDFVERQYRSRYQPSFKEESVVDVTVDPPRSRVSEPRYTEEVVRVTETTVDPPSHSPARSSFSSHRPKSIYREEIVDEVLIKEPRTPKHIHTEDIHITKEVIKTSPSTPKTPTTPFTPLNLEMGYYDEEASAPVATATQPKPPPNTVTIPCHHIRMGDLLMLQGRPCQVIRITTSAATGQHRYLGVDLFTRQLNEESSFISNPSPSVVVQTMLGPVFKQYRVLDLHDKSVVAMTETGDVKQNLPVLDQSNLWSRLKESFEGGRGSVRVMVVQDGPREIVVDLKVIHGSRL
ncbi:hypothetical protein ACMFMG_002190 [Clarireedia jacksonii]